MGWARCRYRVDVAGMCLWERVYMGWPPFHWGGGKGLGKGITPDPVETWWASGQGSVQPGWLLLLEAFPWFSEGWGAGGVPVPYAPLFGAGSVG